MSEFMQTAFDVAVGITVLGLCLSGLALSCLSLSGTWLVTLAALLGTLAGLCGDAGWWMVLAFALLSGLVEVVEAAAGAWGVSARGGSRLAGTAAIIGGLLGLLLGTAIPVPIVGSLLGMLLGSFLLVFAVESRRIKVSRRAAEIAWGAVLARLLVILLKVLVTLAMSVLLFAAIIEKKQQRNPCMSPRDGLISYRKRAGTLRCWGETVCLRR